MRNRDPKILEWCLCFYPHYEPDEDRRGEYIENGTEPLGWLVGRVSDLRWGATNQLREVTFNRMLSNYHTAMEWMDARIKVPVEYVAKVFDDELEAYEAGDLLKRSTHAHLFLGDMIMGQVLCGVRSLLIKGEVERAENVVREQEAMVEKLRDDVKVFQSKMMLLLDKEDMTELLY